MAQPLSALPRKTLVNYTETIGGVAYTEQYMIIATADENPYGNDRCLMLRYRATGKGGRDNTCKYGNTSTDVEYENSVLDDFNENEFSARFDAAFLSAVKTSTISCYRQSDGATYTLARKFFALSNKELGGNYATDPSTPLNAFSNNEDRKCYLSNGTTDVYWWTRSPASGSSVGIVSSYGNLNASNPANINYARPSFNLDSSTLVASEPNEDGSYNLLPDAAEPYRELGFSCLLGETATRAKRARVQAIAAYDKTMTMQVCNNYEDAAPAWEGATLDEEYTFTNTSKTADNWAVGVKFALTGEATPKVTEPVAIVVLDAPE